MMLKNIMWSHPPPGPVAVAHQMMDGVKRTESL